MDGSSTIGWPEIIPLRDGLIIGRGREAEVGIASPEVSRRHAGIERTGAGWQIRDLDSRTGTRANGRLFRSHVLVLGDVLEIGPCSFRFDGAQLVRVREKSGVGVRAEGVVKTVRGRAILHGITLAVAPGTFTGILGASGAGKSTLLDCVSGIRPLTAGTVRFGGKELRAFLDGGAAACGYVPQDDIVHTELTVAEALRFAARLRLPGDVAPAEIEKLVEQTIAQLGLSARAQVGVARLSGGQRKRVSIAAEVLARPAVLFLDEPSSGLDPATESKLMELLRELANLGCTVICTTHVMENVYLFDQLLVVAGGRLAFTGTPAAAREHFGIERFATLYDRIEAEPAEAWAEKCPAPMPPTAAPEPAASPRVKTIAPAYFRIVLERLWRIVSANPRNLALLLGQPVIIGLLVAWMADTVSFKLFLAWLATFWFGCSNAAQEIIKELPIYRRERLVGLGRNAYLLTKFSFWSAATFAQAALLYICIQFGPKTLTGSAEWQLASLAATALVGVAIGSAISALVRTTTQAVMLVPLILLPQIVFSGYVLPSFAVQGAKKTICEMMPSYSSQRIMDVSLFWQEKLAPDYLREHALAFKNIDPGQHLKPGDTFDDPQLAQRALARLLAWTGLSYLTALIALAFKERVE
jgi:ABC-type multidrug transport system ATPase subunit